MLEQFVMILYLNDWRKYGYVIADFETKNKSFLEYAALLKHMGVENHAFCLALHNRKLVGVDPYNPSSQEEAEAILVECKVNPWYYFREVARDSKNPNVYLKANRGNISLYWLYFNHITTALMQPRQTGKTFSMEILFAYLLIIGKIRSTLVLLTKDNKVRSKTFNGVKAAIECNPYYLNTKTDRDPANTELIKVSRLSNEYVGLVPQASEKDALSVGRGLTADTIHVDEISFVNNLKISLPALLATGSNARDLAASLGEHYGTILTTTAGKLDDPDGEHAYSIFSNSFVWTEKLFDLPDINTLKETIEQNSPGRVLRVSIILSHKQLGYTDEWLYRVLKETGSTGEDADRDYFNRFTSGSSSSPLSIEMLEMIRDSINPDYITDISSNSYVTRWYVKPEILLKNETPLVMGLDTSDAIGKDDIAMTIRNVRTGEVVAVGNFNEINLLKFAMWISTWFVRFPKLTAVIERKSSGMMIIDYVIEYLLEKGIDPFTRLYNRIVSNPEKYEFYYKEIQRPLYMRSSTIYEKTKEYFGYNTSGAGENSRNNLYGNTLLNAATYTGSTVRDSVLAKQILGLTVKNGRIDHVAGGHDDLCVSWLLSYWFLTQSKNLSHYGIESKFILCDNTIVKKTIDNNKPTYQQLKLNNTIQEINKLIEELEIEKDQFKIELKIHKLEVLNNSLPEDNRAILAIDSVITEIKNNKRLKQRTRRHFR